MKNRITRSVGWIVCLLALTVQATISTASASTLAPDIDLPLVHHADVPKFSASPIVVKDDALILTGTEEGQLIFVDRDTLEHVYTYDLEGYHEVKDVVKKDEDTVLIAVRNAQYNGTIDILEYTLSTQTYHVLQRDIDYYQSLTWIPDQKGFIVSRREQLDFYTIENNKAHFVRPLPKQRGWNDWTYDENHQQLISVHLVDHGVQARAEAFYYDFDTFSFVERKRAPVPNALSLRTIYDAQNDRLIIASEGYISLLPHTSTIPYTIEKKFRHSRPDTIALDPSGRFLLHLDVSYSTLIDLDLLDSDTTLQQSSKHFIQMSDDRLLLGERYQISQYDISDLQKRTRLVDIDTYTIESDHFVGNDYPLFGRLILSNGTSEPVDLSQLNWTTQDYRVAQIEKGILRTRGTGQATFQTSFLGRTLNWSTYVKTNEPKDGDTFLEQVHPQPVAPDKTWAITVNDDVSYEYVEQKNIFVTDAKGRIVPTLYVIDRHNGSSTIQVINNAHYTPGETYTLWVRELAAENGTPLDQKIKRTFTIASQ